MDLKRLLMLSLEGEEKAKYLLHKELTRMGYDKPPEDGSDKTILITFPMSPHRQCIEYKEFSVYPSHYDEHGTYTSVVSRNRIRRFVLIEMKMPYLNPDLVTVEIGDLKLDEETKFNDPITKDVFSVSTSFKEGYLSIVLKAKTGIDWLLDYAGSIELIINGKYL